jgi:hypothetical protein
MDELTIILILAILVLSYLYFTKKTEPYTVSKQIPSEVVFEDGMDPETVKDMFVKVNQKLVVEMQGKVAEAVKNSKSKDQIISMSDDYHDRIAATSKSFAAWMLKNTDFKGLPST